MWTELDLMPYQASPVPQAQRVLIFAPHADDEVFGCGGAAALHTQQGVQVQTIIVTDGAGRNDESTRRLAESAQAAHILGMQAPICWSLPDRGVKTDDALIHRIAACIDDYNADLVYAPWPGEIHPDHQAIALATLCAMQKLQKSQPQIALYEVGMPLKPTHLVDISAVQAQKQQAMQCFQSQLAYQRYDEHIGGLNRFRSYTLSKAVTAAEAFIMTDAKTLALGQWPVMPAPHLSAAQLQFQDFIPAASGHKITPSKEELQQQLTAMQSSKSWRYTQPARQLLQWLRNL
jgi:LmbE family N-acetylglucosaminyl deacetylase